jgi:hypothetical protein
MKKCSCRKATRGSKHVENDMAWLDRVKACRVCSRGENVPGWVSQGTGWITRWANVAGAIRGEAARCQCLHREILNRGGKPDHIPCAQDIWGAQITQRDCDAEYDRLVAYQIREQQYSRLLALVI